LAAAAALLVLGACCAPGALAQSRALGASLTFENDVFAGSDDNYTNGIQIERVRESDARDVKMLQTFKRFHGAWDKADAIVIRDRVGQLMYTPTDIGNPAPQPLDRPWAGMLYLQRSYRGVVGTERSWDVTLMAGVIGPRSYAEHAQKFVHKHITGSTYPRGWANQIGGALGLNVLAGQRRAIWSDRPLAAGWASSLAWHSRVGVGNVMSFAGLGATLAVSSSAAGLAGEDSKAIILNRIINEAGAIAPPNRCLGINDLRCTLFGDVEVRAIAHNVFLDGNWGRNDPQVDSRGLVADFSVGLRIGIPQSQWYVEYRASQRTPEFRSARPVRPQRWGAITVGVQL
jgi:hypothetical protein